jgi:hypothetical protein
MGDSSSETRPASKAGISVIVRTLGTPQLAVDLVAWWQTRPVDLSRHKAA